MKKYVVGFLFQGDKVALIQKNRPAWQKGKLNGIGGHIEENETPLSTVDREFFEELGYQLEADVKNTLFDLTIKHINNPKHSCKTHYDLWYILQMDKINFNFDKKEFYEAKWVTYDEALSKVKTPIYQKTIEKLIKQQKLALFKFVANVKNNRKNSKSYDQ